MAHRPARHARRTGRRSDTGFRWGGYLVSGVYAVLIILPIYYLVASSLKSRPELLSRPLSPPTHFLISNFEDAVRQVSLLKAMGISFWVTGGAEVVTLLLAIPAAYAIGRIQLPSARWVEVFFSLGFLVPAFAIMVPLFLFAARVELVGNPIMLVLFYPATRLPLSVLVLAAYFRQVPDELEEVAQVDGAGRIRRLRHVLLPVIRPGIITVVILNFVDIWNEYLFALIVLGSDNQTAQVAVPLLRSEHGDNFQLLAAGSVITLVPVYLIFVFFQRRLIQGMLAGAIKG